MAQFNNLNGFDMVYAVTEQTINAQFKLLYAMEILPGEWKATLQNGLYVIDAQLGCPSVSLNTGDSSSRKALMTIPLTTASFTYASIGLDANGNPVVEKATKDISGSKLKLKINVSLAEIAATYKDAAHIPQSVKDQLQNFDDSMFNLQHLFLNLEDADLLDSFEFDTNGIVNTNQPELIRQVRSLLESFINTKKGSENPYILGYSVVNKRPDPVEPTWKPTGVTYSVYTDAAHLSRSSLNYLLETAGKPVPGSGAGIFNHNWVNSDEVQGSFVFSQELILTKLIESLARVLHMPSSVFKNNNANEFFANAPNDIGGITVCTVTPISNSNTIQVKFNNHYKKNMHDQAGSYIGYIDGEINWVSTIHYDVDSKNNSIKVSVTNSDPTTTKNDHPNALGKFERVLAIFADFIISIVTFGQVNDVFQNMIKTDWSANITSGLETGVKDLTTRIIMPAGSELMFKDTRFYSDGSLMLTTTIKN
jgi:hypothetical protein